MGNREIIGMCSLNKVFNTTANTCYRKIYNALLISSQDINVDETANLVLISI